jgi:hypothetical protein
LEQPTLVNKSFGFISLAALFAACHRDTPANSARDQTSAAADSAVTENISSLAPSMERALLKYAPGFVLFAAHEYASNQGADTVSRVEADFNGDGKGDAAFYGHDTTRELLLVLLSDSAGSYKVYTVIENKLEPHPNGVGISLRVHPPGPLDIPETLREANTPQTLKYAALDVGFGQEAGEVLYWDGSKFVKVITGD